MFSREGEGWGVFLFLTDFLLNLFSPQTLLFMRDETLMGRKIELYVLLKILKYCTNSPVTSFQCKFALDRVFSYKNIESMAEMGVAIKEILHYKTLRLVFVEAFTDQINKYALSFSKSFIKSKGYTKSKSNFQSCSYT